MTFRVDGVSASYPQWQRSCCCDGRSVGKLGPGRVCGVLGAMMGVKYALGSQEAISEAGRLAGCRL